MKIEYQYINRDFNRKTTDFLLEIEFDQLKKNPEYVFEIIDKKKLPLRSVFVLVRSLYLRGKLLFLFISIWIALIILSFFDFDTMATFGILIMFGWTLKILFAFKQSYTSEKDRQYFERYYYELHNEIVKNSETYDDYLREYEERKRLGKLAWRPNL
jgi:hypothetical protein